MKSLLFFCLLEVAEGPNIATSGNLHPFTCQISILGDQQSILDLFENTFFVKFTEIENFGEKSCFKICKETIWIFLRIFTPLPLKPALYQLFSYWIKTTFSPFLLISNCFVKRETNQKAHELHSVLTFRQISKPKIFDINKNLVSFLKCSLKW